MRTLAKLAGPLAIVATCALGVVPAHAQFEGAGDQMAELAPIMEQLAPMMQMTKARISKRQMAQMMQMVEPMTSMVSMGGLDMSQLAGIPGIEGLAGMMGGGSAQRARKRK